MPVYAYDGCRRETSEKGYLFAVPEGGWSSANVQATYSEWYNSNGSNNNFCNREKYIAYRLAYATSAPGVAMKTVTHSNGISFEPWVRRDAIYGAQWDWGYAMGNTNSVIYGYNTDVIAKLPYVVACPGGIPALYAGSVDVALKTQ